MTEAAAAPSAYQQRYCAYVDVLGFSGLITRLEQGSIDYEVIKRLLGRVHSPVAASSIRQEDAGFRATSISDAVAASAPVTAVGLHFLCEAIAYLAYELLWSGYLVRGAIVKGKLYHDDKMVFGPALVRAYHLESEVVRYPRVMVTSDVIADSKIFEKGDDQIWWPPTGVRFLQSEDGPWHLHFFRELTIALNNWRGGHTGPPDDDMVKAYRRLREQLQKMFDEAVDNPRHFEKLRWFATYWNRTMPTDVPGFDPVIGPGVAPHAFWA